MAQQHSLNVQCFVKKEFQSMFVGENDPRLLYVSEIRPDAADAEGFRAFAERYRKGIEIERTAGKYLDM